MNCWIARNYYIILHFQRNQAIHFSNNLAWWRNSKKTKSFLIHFPSFPFFTAAKQVYTSSLNFNSKQTQRSHYTSVEGLQFESITLFHTIFIDGNLFDCMTMTITTVAESAPPLYLPFLLRYKALLRPSTMSTTKIKVAASAPSLLLGSTVNARINHPL